MDEVARARAAVERDYKAEAAEALDGQDYAFDEPTGQVWVDGWVCGVVIEEERWAAVEARQDRDRMEAALVLIRENHVWTCTCIQRPRHDPRCPVEIARAALAPEEAE